MLFLLAVVSDPRGLLSRVSPSFTRRLVKGIFLDPLGLSALATKVGGDMNFPTLRALKVTPSLHLEVVKGKCPTF